MKEFKPTVRYRDPSTQQAFEKKMAVFVANGGDAQLLDDIASGNMPKAELDATDASGNDLPPPANTLAKTQNIADRAGVDIGTLLNSHEDLIQRMSMRGPVWKALSMAFDLRNDPRLGEPVPEEVLDDGEPPSAEVAEVSDSEGMDGMVDDAVAVDVTDVVDDAANSDPPSDSLALAKGLWEGFKPKLEPNKDTYQMDVGQPDAASGPEPSVNSDDADTLPPRPMNEASDSSGTDEEISFSFMGEDFSLSRKHSQQVLSLLRLLSADSASPATSDSSEKDQADTAPAP
jgi:hypothetical protein